MRMTFGLTAILAAASLLGACQQDGGPVGPGPAPPASGTPGPRLTAGTGEACAGYAGIACRMPGDVCKMPSGQCQVRDGQGTCTPRREMCTKIYAPVCGCDGKTYGNACEADAAGAAVDREGACGTP